MQAAHLNNPHFFLSEMKELYNEAGNGLQVKHTVTPVRLRKLFQGRLPN